ncbi:EAL domain-containing protein [uncultured Ferrovibrio sp.]|jgi:PAS domain S-box-containing protein|uniref:EAL domain-containing protein n=1 Tax=uncultured Ferrovibrio sp. TaxID=1576913 RepID=UPI002624926B|nr:EAL domain-containing protein [uncultured Ferrovibrio sp.]
MGGGAKDIRAERDRFVAFAFSAADLMLEVTAEGQITFASGAARLLTGMEADALVGRQFASLVDEADRHFILNLLSTLSVGGRIEPVTLRLVGADGASGALCVLGGCCLPLQEGRYYLTLSNARLPAAEAAMLNKRDYQTGLLGPEDFDARAGERLKLARELGAEVKLTLLEIVGLQELAQTLPPEEGKALMSDVGALLRGKSIGGDTASRIDPEKYGILHAKALDQEAVAEQVRQLIVRAGPDAAADMVGIRGATLDLHAKDMSDEDAASAMAFAVQRFARDGAESFSFRSTEDSLKALLNTTVARVRALRSAVAGQKFQLVFQPIVRLDNRTLHHYEALSRFEDGGSPFETIRLAEGVHMIGEFDLAVVQRVVDLLAERRRQGEIIDVAVNLSGHSLESTVFMAALREILAPVPELRRQLIFEITESTQITDLVHAANAVRQLREDGHSVCLDDFGAGAASFPYLQALDVDYVKIDGAYVKALQTTGQDRDRAILKGMVWLCKELRIGTVAEMVETEDQARLLHDFGIDYGQGYLFGRPESEPRLEPLRLDDSGGHLDPTQVPVTKRR